MSYSDEEWRRSKKDANRVTWWILGWIIIGAIVLGLLGWAAWGISVAISGPKGQGDATVEKNSAANWTAAQAGFEQKYQDILSTDLKIVNAHTLLLTSPDDKTLMTNYSGLTSYCLSAVAEYNADARSYLSQEFRSADLPSEIDIDNSTTDCKE